MDNLFEIECEKYWDIPRSVVGVDRENKIKSCIESNNYIASIKKDGHYNRTIINNGVLQMQSRSISKVTGMYADKQNHVPHIAKTLKNLPDNTVLIGELYQQGKVSSDMTSILQCLPEKAVQRQKTDYGFVSYYIHDCWYYNGQNLLNTPYEKRIFYVKEIYETYLKDNPYIERATYAITPKTINEMLSYARGNGEEGIVLVKKTAIVEPGKRTAWKTVKVKKELDKSIDCFLTGRYKTATRLYTGKELKTWLYWEDLKNGKLVKGDYFYNYTKGEPYEPVTKPYFYGWPGSLELGILVKGKPEIFGYVSGISDEIKQDVLENNSIYVNRPCKVSAMQFTEDMKLRHPRFIEFRDDLSIEDCTMEKILGNFNK